MSPLHRFQQSFWCTVNRLLLFTILEKIGCPLKLSSLIKFLYTNVKPDSSSMVNCRVLTVVSNKLAIVSNTGPGLQTLPTSYVRFRIRINAKKLNCLFLSTKHLFVSFLLIALWRGNHSTLSSNILCLRAVETTCIQ